MTTPIIWLTNLTKIYILGYYLEVKLHSRCMSQTELEGLFCDSVSDEWCQDMLKAVREAYIFAHNNCVKDRLNEANIHDLHSHLLRSVIETELLSISMKHGMKAESQHNSRKSYHHTVVEAGNIRFTASSVRNSNKMPRYAEFRHLYQSNGQLPLWKDDIKNELLVYAILLYGPSHARLPSFVKIVFPSKHCKNYVESIDLISKYPNIIEGFATEETTYPIVTPKSIEETILKPKPLKIRQLPKRIEGT